MNLRVTNYDADGEPESEESYTLDEFMAANTGALDADDVLNILAGVSITLGGGASPLYKIVRSE